MLSVIDTTKIEDVVSHIINTLCIPDPKGDTKRFCVNKLHENLILNVGLLKRINAENLSRLNLPLLLEQELEDLATTVELPDSEFLDFFSN
jgi:hypothetical protein